MENGVGGGVGVDRRHVDGRVLRFGEAGEDQAVHTVQQRVGVPHVQEVVEVFGVVGVVRVVGVVWGEGVGQLTQFAIVTQVVQGLVVLLDGPVGGQAWAQTVMLSVGGVLKKAIK